jgi:DNA (cytosine-5)-methyltransferase 1
MTQLYKERNRPAFAAPKTITVAEEIRRAREALRLSQPELADLLQYSHRQLVRWESGKVIPRATVMDAVRRLVMASHDAGREEGGDFTFVDLFAGIGGMRRGFNAVGGRCVFTSEWDKNSLVTYRANYGENHPIVADDIGTISADAIPPHDVLLAGFPCQPFSLAGVSKKNSLGRPHGFQCNTQGTLFFDIQRIIQRRRPKAFLLENVKHLLRHDQGRTWKVIDTVLRKELGYDVYPMLVNARAVLPQNRDRVYIVGFREPASFDVSDLQLAPRVGSPTLRTILHPEDGSEEPEEPYTDGEGRVSKRYTLSDHLWTYLQNYARKHQAKGNGFGFSLVGPDDVARTLSARYHKDGSEILVRRRRGNPRRLTPRECARLMGFDPLLGVEPPSYQRFKIPVSDTQAYRQFGNSVAVPVVEAIAKLMKPHIIGAALPREQLSLELTGHAV